MGIGRYLDAVLVQDAYEPAAQSSDEVAEFQDDVLPCAARVRRRVGIDKAAP